MSTRTRHIIYWIIIYILWTFMKSSGATSRTLIFAKVNLINIPIFMMAYYFLKHVQMPYLFNQNKKVLFFISLIFSSLFLYLCWRLFGILWFDKVRNLGSIPFMRFDRYLVYAVQFYSPAILLLVWEIQEERIKESERILNLEKEKIHTELKYLKAQLNPHFLFNTFNNLYSLVINEDPAAPKMILQLSSILDYLLYKSQVDSVALKEEVEVIKEYIGIEKIRYGERLDVEFKCDGNLDVPVSPLLFLSMVENAFKHGASGDVNNPKIRIRINSVDNMIVCNIWNTKSIYNGELKDIHKKGLGLSNIKRQLDLRYPDQHKLAIKDKETDYEIDLTLNLASE